MKGRIEVKTKIVTDELPAESQPPRDFSLDVVSHSRPRKTQLIDRSHVKAFLLDQAKRTRAHKFTQVSELTLATANEALREWLVNHVKMLPSKGTRI